MIESRHDDNCKQCSILVQQSARTTPKHDHRRIYYKTKYLTRAYNCNKYFLWKHIFGTTVNVINILRNPGRTTTTSHKNVHKKLESIAACLMERRICFLIFIFCGTYSFSEEVCKAWEPKRTILTCRKVIEEMRSNHAVNQTKILVGNGKDAKKTSYRSMYLRECNDTASTVDFFLKSQSIVRTEDICKEVEEYYVQQLNQKIIAEHGIDTLMPRAIGMGPSETGSSITFSTLRNLPGVYTAERGSVAEVQHFNREFEYSKGLQRYAYRFLRTMLYERPALLFSSEKEIIHEVLKSDFVEKTPQYAGDVIVPFRIFSDIASMPNLKFIFNLRDPVVRACKKYKTVDGFLSFKTKYDAWKKCRAPYLPPGGDDILYPTATSTSTSNSFGKAKTRVLKTTLSNNNNVNSSGRNDTNININTNGHTHQHHTSHNNISSSASSNNNNNNNNNFHPFVPPFQTQVAAAFAVEEKAYRA